MSGIGYNSSAYLHIRVLAFQYLLHLDNVLQLSRPGQLIIGGILQQAILRDQLTQQISDESLQVPYKVLQIQLLV
jgi:hypothetical protein